MTTGKWSRGAYGYDLYLRVGKGGVVINIYTSLVLMFGFELVSGEDKGHWFSVSFGPLNVTYFPWVDWD